MRLKDIDRITGIAILLVVIGHLATGQTVEMDGMQWYKILKKIIYSFHMPLFMFISGFIFYFTYKPLYKTNDFLNYYQKKFLRLFPSFFLFAVLVYFSKKFMQSFMYVDNPVNSINDFFKIFYEPSKSVAGYLWYIYVLFELYLFVPIFLALSKQKIEWLIIPAFIIYFVPITSIGALNYLFEYLLVFILGGVCAKYKEIYYKIIDKFKWAFIAVFLILISLLFFYHIPKLLTGLTSIPALHSFVRLNIMVKDRFLIMLGKYTFSIYLMNTLASGLIKGLIFKFTPFTYNHFYIISILMALGGIFIPILIKKFIINNIPVLKNYIG